MKDEEERQGEEAEERRGGEDGTEVGGEPVEEEKLSEELDVDEDVRER